jgi:hypothetical protein
MKTLEENNKWLLDFAKDTKFANVPLSKFLFDINPALFLNADDREKHDYNINFLKFCTTKPNGSSHTLTLTGDVAYTFDDVKLFKILRINSRNELLFEYSDDEIPRFNEWINPQYLAKGWVRRKDEQDKKNSPSLYHFVVGKKAACQYVKEIKIFHTNDLYKKHFDSQAFSVHEVNVKTHRLGFVMFAKDISDMMWGGTTTEMFIHEEPLFVEKL